MVRTNLGHRTLQRLTPGFELGSYFADGPGGGNGPGQTAAVTAKWYCTLSNMAFCTYTSACNMMPVIEFGVGMTDGLLTVTTENESLAFQLVGKMMGVGL
jgi:hypothetical protein